MADKIGRLITYLETGMEGSYWAFAEDGVEDFSGLTFLKGKVKLTVRTPVSKKAIFSGTINFLNTLEAVVHPYFKQYVRKDRYSAEPRIGQLCICGMWFHHIPDGIDLVFIWELTKSGIDTNFEVVLHEKPRGGKRSIASAIRKKLSL